MHTDSGYCRGVAVNLFEIANDIAANVLPRFKQAETDEQIQEAVKAVVYMAVDVTVKDIIQQLETR